MPCYTYQTYTTVEPMLTSVPRAYILTMANGKRMTSSKLSRLCQLARTTVVQINHRGSKGCTKPECTQKSNFDIVHAYRSACKHARGVGDDEPILFLEDDAIVRKDAKRSEFDAIDSFLEKRGFDVYTLGSIGIVPPWSNTHPHYSLLVLWHAQATIWSQATREKLITMDIASIPHIDAHFLTRLPRKFKFERPLVVQTFPDTENSKSWCLHCSDGVIGGVERWGASVWSKWYRDGLGLDTQPFPGWDTLNWLTHMTFSLVLVLTITIVFLTYHLYVVHFRRAPSAVDMSIPHPARRA